jgi:hypothetical protein
MMNDDDVMYYYKAQLAVANTAPGTPRIVLWKATGPVKASLPTIT